MNYLSKLPDLCGMGTLQCSSFKKKIKKKLKKKTPNFIYNTPLLGLALKTYTIRVGPIKSVRPFISANHS